jgi:APA family basic amino acid/polyamine antiporter
MSHQPNKAGLTRQLGLLTLVATGVCSMMGASINIVPFMLHRNVPDIGGYAMYAYLLAIIPAILAAFPYAVLGSAMPRAGGSYVYASRSLSPYWGFVASFSQWFGLCIAIGVVSYVTVPFLRDIFVAMNLLSVAATLDKPLIRLVLALMFLWFFVWVNIRGLKTYEKTLLPLMYLMFISGFVLIAAGFYFDRADFVQAAGVPAELLNRSAPFSWNALFSAAAILFSSFIGFDAIAQAGGEAKNPGRFIPLAIGLAILTVGLFDFVFTAAVYHSVPWQYISQKALEGDITAPGLLSILLPGGITVLIVAGAAIALINDLPAMLLSVSRLIFAWAEDGIFPASLAKVHQNFHTPHRAVVLSALFATGGILGSHFAGDFFLGVDILVTSMLVNFFLMCLSLIYLPKRNAALYLRIKIFRSPSLQRTVSSIGAIVLLIFLTVHIHKDVTSDVAEWYFKATPIWLIVLGIASLIYLFQTYQLRKSGVDIRKLFSKLPPE